jgi:ADP-ribosylglycohydrolase
MLGPDRSSGGKKPAALAVTGDVKPIDRALLSLEGLSVGDAFGERFFGPEERVAPLIARRAEPAGLWRWTDDTQMAVAIVDELDRAGAIEQDALAALFAERMDPARGYGAGAYRTLLAIQEGAAWRRASSDCFRGRGSFGNGAAMRVAPLGAFFANDLDRCVEQARLSAEITHMHGEGIAGAIAIAVAAALTWQRHGAALPNGRSWLERVCERVPAGYVRAGIEEALRLPSTTSTTEAAAALGNGTAVTAPDTVPFCLWMAAWHSHDFPEALWQTVSAGGDRDTTCAIVGGIAALQVGERAIPTAWRHARERLPFRIE